MPTTVRAEEAQREQTHRVQDRVRQTRSEHVPDGTAARARVRARIRTTMASFTFGAGNARKLLGLPLYACSALVSLVVPRSDRLWVFGSGIGLGEGALPLYRLARERLGDSTRLVWLARSAAELEEARALGFDADPQGRAPRVLDDVAGPRHRRDPRVRRRQPLRRPRRLRRAAVARPAVQAPAPRLAVDVPGVVPARRRCRAPDARLRLPPGRPRAVAVPGVVGAGEAEHRQRVRRRPGERRRHRRPARRRAARRRRGDPPEADATVAARRGRPGPAAVGPRRAVRAHVARRRRRPHRADR